VSVVELVETPGRACRSVELVETPDLPRHLDHPESVYAAIFIDAIV